jgi:hypothetical protein
MKSDPVRSFGKKIKKSELNGIPRMNLLYRVAVRNVDLTQISSPKVETSYAGKHFTGKNNQQLILRKCS